jgi:hypothetical protein
MSFRAVCVIGAGIAGVSAATFDFADLRSGERWRRRINDGRLPWQLFDRNRRAPGTTRGEYFAPLPMLLRAPASQTIVEALTCAGPLYDLDAPDEFRAIVNAHFRVAPPPAQPAILGVVNGLIEWLFAYPGRLLAATSGADRLIDRPRGGFAAEIGLDVAAPTALSATPLPQWRIVKEKRATFAATPDQNRKRPPARTRIDNVALAGGWAATIEGVVRSGYKAASVIFGIGATAPRPNVTSVSS